MVAVKALANGIEPGRNQATQRFHVLCPKDGLPPASHQHTKIGARADVSARVCASVLKCLKRGPRGCRSSVIFPLAAVYLRLNFGGCVDALTLSLAVLSSFSFLSFFCCCCWVVVFFVHFAQEEWNQMLRSRFRRRGHNKGIAIRASTGAREGRGGAPDVSLSRPPRPFQQPPCEKLPL